MISERQKYLTKLLDEAARAYELDNEEIMSNFEYDRLYDELVMLEKQSGTVLASSPTAHPGYEVKSELPKFRHETPALSLDKTKSVDELSSWLGDKEGVLSWKMDGLTVILTYEDGELIRAVTRGNGTVGEIITANARVFKNIPASIRFKGSLTVRGEAVITYSDFDKINEKLPAEDRYKNPRNLCSGTVRQLDNRVTAARNVNFFAFSLTSASGDDYYDTDFKYIEQQYEFLEEMGFTVVEREIVDRESIFDAVVRFSEKINDNDFPSDGLVLIYNDIAYGKSLGTTAKFPRNAIAFKWKDETVLTTILDVEWSPSRTGLINPVAIFEPVELEGTTVSRASLHNVSVLRSLAIGIGDTVSVYKANMIIPQIADNMTCSNDLEIPKICPVCGGATEVRESQGNSFLYCSNPECAAKKIGSFVNFVSRDAMNIEGVSEQTLEKFIGLGYIHDFSDLYRLKRHKAEIVKLDGFGEKSYENIIDSIEKSKDCELSAFINALGIANVGRANAKLVCAYFDDDFDALMSATAEELTAIPQVGEVIANSFYEYMHNENNLKVINELREYLRFVKEEKLESGMSGLSFVITGSVNSFANRNELKDYIEKRGGKVLSKVSKNTDYLINNDITSSSSKNKDAKAMGVPIITEDEFLKKFPPGAES